MKKLTILATDLQRLKKYKDEHHIKRSYEALTHLLNNYENTIKLKDGTREALDGLCTEHQRTYDEIINLFLDLLKEDNALEREKALRTDYNKLAETFERIQAEYETLVQRMETTTRQIDTPMGERQLTINKQVFLLSTNEAEEDLKTIQFAICMDCFRVIPFSSIQDLKHDCKPVINHTIPEGGKVMHQQAINTTGRNIHNTSNTQHNTNSIQNNKPHKEKSSVSRGRGAGLSNSNPTLRN